MTPFLLAKQPRIFMVPNIFELRLGIPGVNNIN